MNKRIPKLYVKFVLRQHAPFCFLIRIFHNIYIYLDLSCWADSSSAYFIYNALIQRINDFFYGNKLRSILHFKSLLVKQQIKKIFLKFWIMYRKKSIDTTWSTMRFLVLDHGVNMVYKIVEINILNIILCNLVPKRQTLCTQGNLLLK